MDECQQRPDPPRSPTTASSPAASTAASGESPDQVDGVAALAVLGQRLHDRAGEVAATVLAARTSPRSAGEVRGDVDDVLLNIPQLAAELIGRYLATGQSAEPAERQRLAATARLPVDDYMSLTELTKCYLGWRDAAAGVLAEEGARLGVSTHALDQAVRVVRRSCDASLIEMMREFDAQRRELRQGLQAERAKLAHLALRDPLTGLANRTLLMQRMAHASTRAARSAGRPGALFLDLDTFKAVNDNLGHEAGDQMLITVAQRLTALVRPSDTVARLGGDEFVILCEDITHGEEELTALATRIQASLTRSCPPQAQFPVSVSIGVALYTADDDPEQLLARADAAMYAAKHHSRHRPVAP